MVQGNDLMRILNVAAFAVSGYASTEGRQCKPFNPLLGETYEADYPDKGLRFFSEKVRFFLPTEKACFFLPLLVNFYLKILESKLNSPVKFCLIFNKVHDTDI